MEIGIALALIFGSNILVGVIQLLIFVKVVRAAQELNNMAAEHVSKITEISLDALANAGIRVDGVIKALETMFIGVRK